MEMQTLEALVLLVERGANERAFGLLENGGFALLEAALSETTWNRRGRLRARGADYAYWLLARLPNRYKARVTPELLAWTIPFRAAQPRPFAVRSQLRRRPLLELMHRL
jgi:hypothetical protein